MAEQFNSSEQSILLAPKDHKPLSDDQIDAMIQTARAKSPVTSPQPGQVEVTGYAPDENYFPGDSMLTAREVSEAEQASEQIRAEEKLAAYSGDSIGIMLANARLTPITPIQKGETKAGFVPDEGWRLPLVRAKKKLTNGI